MRVDTPATTSSAAQPTPPEAVVAGAPAQAVAQSAAGAPDAIDTSAVAPAAQAPKTPAATELDNVFNDVRASLRACGDSFPALVGGTEYAITPEGFTAPLEAIVKRAKEYGHKNPRDYALGEVTVELGMKRFGYQRTDARLRNSAWNLLFTLLETVASARTMIARYPALEPQIKLYMTTKWTALANNTKQRSETLSTFMLACISGALSGNDVPMKGLSDKASEAVSNGKDALSQLTVPADTATLAKLEADAQAADAFANDRLNQAMQLFFPPFRTLIEMELSAAQAAAPKAEAASASTRKLVSAEEAAKQHQERISKREASATPDTKLEQQAAAAASDFIDTIRRYSGQDRFVTLVARPTPSNVRAAIAALVDRGHKEPGPQIFDRTVALILQTLLKSAGNRFGGVNDRTIDAAAWSASYMRALSGPDMGSVIADPIQPAPVERLGQASDMRSRMYEAKTVPPEAQDWLRAQAGRRRDLDNNAARGEELARFDGVTGEIGRLLNSLRTEGADAYDRASRAVDDMNRGRWRDQAPAFEDAQARFRGVIHRNDQVQALLGVLDDESGFKKALRLNRGANDKELLAGAQRMGERQKAARDYLDGVFRNYGAATNKLRDILEPRLSWYTTAITNSAMTRQSDPLLPLMDAGWLGVVTAELRRAELTGQRIDAFVRSLPPAQAELIAPEYTGGRETLIRDLIEDVAGQLAEDLAGKSLDAVGAGNVAAFKARALPALAARPRLAFLCDAAKALDLDVKDMNDVQHFVDVALLNTDNSAPYAIDVAQKNQDGRAKAGRDDYSFWSRTFDLSAPSKIFLDELLGWRMYYAPALAQVVDNAQAADAGTDKVEQVVEGALAKADASTVSKATAAMTTALAAKDTATITTYLSARDAGIRDTARKALAKLGNTTTAAILESQVTRDELGTPRLYAICDMVNNRDFARSAVVLGSALGATDATTRAVVTFALAAIASNDLHASTTIAQQLMKLLTDTNPNVVQLAGDALIQMLARGGDAVARDVLAIIHDQVLTEPTLIPLLTAIANNKKLPESIVVDAGREAERLRAYARQEGISTPRRIATKRTTQTVRKDVDMAALTLSAARGEHDIDAISDRVKLAMRLGSKFEEWSTRARETRPNTRMQLEKLDFADALIDDAVSELTGKTPRGYLAQTPDLVTELMGSPSFSSSEVHLLATGRIPERLTALANHPLATSGQWLNVKLDSLAGNPDDLQAAVTLKLELSKDLSSVVGEIIATLLATNKSAIATGVYKALTETLGHPIPLLDPSLSDAQRAEAVAAAEALPPSIEALVERAIVERLALVDPTSAQAGLFVAYLANGDRDAADKRLTSAFEHATSLPQAKLLIDTMRGRMKGRNLAPSASDPWVIALFKTEPQVTLEQLVTVRDSVSEARLASEATATAVAGERVTTLANAVIAAHPAIAPNVLNDLLGVVADAESDRDRQSILDGMKELVGAKQIEWTPSRAATLRRGLLMVARNQRYAGGAAVEQTLSTMTRTFTAAPGTPDADLSRILEIIARCTESLARTSFGDALNRMIQAQPRGQLLSSGFLVDLDRWLASTEVGGSNVQRHRDAIQRGIVELLPLADGTMTQLVDSCMGLDEKRVSDILRACADHRRNAALTAEDVVKIATKAEGDAPAQEVDSFFGKLIGSKIGAALWKASSAPWSDPLERKFNDSDEVSAAKRELARSLDFMNDAFAPQRRTLSAPVDMTRFLGRESYAGRGALGVYAATSYDPAKGGDDPTNFKRFDYRAQIAGSRTLVQDARNRLLDGKSAVEQDIALTLEKSRSIAAAFDGSLGRTRKTRWRAGFEGPRLNVSRYVEQQIQKRAYEKRLEIAEKEGRTVEGAGITRLPIYLAPVRAVGDDRQSKVLVNFIFDYSGSMEEDDRIVFMKRVAAMMLNACGMTRDLTIDSSLIVFSDDATMLIAPAAKHDKRTVVQALDPLKPYKGTALHRGLELAMTAGKQGDYDMIVDIVLTDGKPNKVGNIDGVVACKARVGLLRDAGHVVLGFGVGPDVDHMSGIFGSDSQICENEPARIAPRIFQAMNREVERAIKR